MNFKELFVYYDHVLAFYNFVKIHNKVLIQNPQDTIELLFDMDEINLDKNWSKTRVFFKTSKVL